jgi:hypothetical protein
MLSDRASQLVNNPPEDAGIAAARRAPQQLGEEFSLADARLDPSEYAFAFRQMRIQTLDVPNCSPKPGRSKHLLG